MVVGDNVTVVADDYARAEAYLALAGLLGLCLLWSLLAAPGAAEEEIKERVVEGVGAVAVAVLLLLSRRCEALDADDTVDGLLGGADEILLRDICCGHSRDADGRGVGAGGCAVVPGVCACGHRQAQYARYGNDEAFHCVNVLTIVFFVMIFRKYKRKID